MPIKFIGFLVVFILTASAIGLGQWDVFLDFPSLVMVLGLTGGLIAHKFGKKGLTFWTITNQERRKQIMNWSGKAALHVGLFSSLIGLIQLTSALKNISHLGPALAVCFLPLFYSYLIFLFLGIQEGGHKSTSAASSSKNNTKTSTKMTKKTRKAA